MATILELKTLIPNKKPTKVQNILKVIENIMEIGRIHPKNRRPKNTSKLALQD